MLSEYGCIFEDGYGGFGMSQGIKNSTYECIRDCIGLNIYYTMLNGVSIQQRSDGKVNCSCQRFLVNIKERPGFKCCKLIRKLFPNFVNPHPKLISKLSFDCKSEPRFHNGAPIPRSNLRTLLKTKLRTLFEIMFEFKIKVVLLNRIKTK